MLWVNFGRQQNPTWLLTHSYTVWWGIKRVKMRKFMNQDKENFRRKESALRHNKKRKYIETSHWQAEIQPFFRNAGFYYTHRTLNLPLFYFFLHLYKLSLTPSFLTGGCSGKQKRPWCFKSTAQPIHKTSLCYQHGFQHITIWYKENKLHPNQN